MWMTECVRRAKEQLRDVYGLVPSRVADGEPCFDNVPDGIYPMDFGRGSENTVIVGGRFYFCLPLMRPAPRGKTSVAT